MAETARERAPEHAHDEPIAAPHLEGRYVTPLARATQASRFGGKTAPLATLAGLALEGARVPDGFAVGVELFRDWITEVLPAGQWPERLVLGPALERRADRVESIRARLLQQPLPERARVELRAAYDALGRGVVAVRSSALHEDGKEGSAAGLQETILGVEGPEALLDAVRVCLASLYRERAIAYLARAHADRRGTRGAFVETPPGIAVLVQRMVAADRAGVLFTVDPVNPRSGVLLLEAAHGLGLGVVDGSLSPDTYRLERDASAARLVARTVGHKPFAHLLEGASVRRVALDETRARDSVLDRETAERIARVGLAIERAQQSPRDIEWALCGETLYLLQSRPIAGLDTVAAARDDDRTGRAHWVWSNVNVGEALPGVATPLTWSIGAAFSERGFRQAFASLGCDVPPDAELVAQFQGRIYLNLTHFLRVASQVPLLDPTVLLEFGGGGGLELVREQMRPPAWARFLRRIPRVSTRLLRENLLLDRDLRAFDRDFSAYRARLAATSLTSLSDEGLASLFDEHEALLSRTGVLMLACASGSLASILALRILLRARTAAAAPRLERELLSGNAELESAAPGVALVHIGEQLRRDARALEALRAIDLSQPLSVQALPDGPARRALESFLRAYGFRAAREAELSTPRWSEDARALFAALRGQLEGGAEAAATALLRVERQFATRAAAERELASMLPPIAQAAARHLLSRTRRFVRLRERMRARVTEVLGFFRSAALEVCARMAKRVPTAGPDGAFFLRVDELRAWLRLVPVDVHSLVLARRAQYLRDVARPDPPGVFVGEPPPVLAPSAPSSDRLRGVAASPGCVTGVARVLRDPAEAGELRPGEVLVAPVADVGWTPLFLLAAAVVTELGGALSHAAVVAREYGVPSVVNVAGVTRAVRTGDRVRVDGDRGTVEVLDREGQGASAGAS